MSSFDSVLFTLTLDLLTFGLTCVCIALFPESQHVSILHIKIQSKNYSKVEYKSELYRGGV